MSNHPVNLAVRFFVELAALFALGYAGWTQNEGILRPLIGIGLPVLAAVTQAREPASVSAPRRP